MTRHRIAKPPPRKGTEYRIRFRSTFHGKTYESTAYPGIIKNNRPSADSFLEAIQRGHPEAWLEYRDTPNGTEWKKL